jgi:hypothetical protein
MKLSTSGKEKDRIKKNKSVPKKVRTRTLIRPDSNKPKAPTSSFLLFLHDHKNEISFKFKESNIKRLTKLASQRWKELSIC